MSQARPKPFALDSVLDDIANPIKAYLEPERVTLAVRQAIHWAYQGIVPPDIYRQTFRRAWLTFRAYDRLMGKEAAPRGEE